MLSTHLATHGYRMMVNEAIAIEEQLDQRLTMLRTAQAPGAPTVQERQRIVTLATELARASARL